MSIEELILEHVGSGDLVRWEPMLPKNRKGRGVYLSPAVVWLLDHDHAEEEAVRRCAELAQELHGFADNRLVGVCMTPYKANDDASLGLLAPAEDGVWDYRSVESSPGLRIVGGFAARDTFIGLEWAPRSTAFLGKKPLGSRDTREWRDIIGATNAHWRRLFMTLGPHKGEKLNEYLSQKCHPV